MQNLDNNNFMILNSIIYKMHTQKDFATMRRELLEQMKMVLDFDSADFHLSKGDGSAVLTSQVTYNYKYDVSKDYQNIDYSQGILSSGKSMVYRETDILSDEKRVETEYYSKVYKANNWHYALQLVLAYDNIFMGVITFYRNKGKDDFKYSDIFQIELIKDHLAYRIFKEKELENLGGDKLTITSACEKFSLTKRERDILEMIMSGMDNTEICEASVITNNTLKKHILNIYRKIGVKTRIQLFKLIKERE